jgi:ubiquitin carboxyl-terminal hydrolase 25/28
VVCFIHATNPEQISSLFYGKSRQKISSMDTSNRSRSSLHEKEDIFSHLPVQVSDEGYDIYDGISTYFDDVVEFEGHRAQMEISLVDLPPVLQIQLQVWHGLHDRDVSG